MVRSKKRVRKVIPAVPEDKTHAGVFIIESLSFRDERKKRFEGRILKDMLTLSGKRAEYWYVRTWKELTDDIFQRFYDSKLRYLHLSCHGSPTHVCLTLDNVPFDEFGEEIRHYLKALILLIIRVTEDDKHINALMAAIKNKSLPIQVILIDAVRKPPASKLRTTM